MFPVHPALILSWLHWRECNYIPAFYLATVIIAICGILLPRGLCELAVWRNKGTLTFWSVASTTVITLANTYELPLSNTINSSTTAIITLTTTITTSIMYIVTAHILLCYVTICHII